MSRFLEHLHDLVGAFTEYVLEPLKATSRGLVEDDEYVLVFIVFLGIPALIVTLLIARCIRRAHNRVRYATEYGDTDGARYVSTSSSASTISSGADEVGTDLPSTAGLRRRRGRRNEVSMDEVVRAARQLTEQETERRRRTRREAARGERGRAGGGAAGEPAPDGETEGKED